MNRSERRAQWRQQNRARINARATNRTNRVTALHIDELVLHGFPFKTRHAVADATQLELTRLLQATGLPEFVKTQRGSDAIDGGSFNVTPATKPQVVGNLIAKAVHGGHWR